jgi:DNA polymerase-1
MEMPLAKTLANTEHEGFLLDTEGLSAYGEILDGRLSERIANIYELSGCNFNINSPKQLGDVLYNTLSLPTFKKTKSGFSTDAETLEKLRPYHPIINEILDYRVVSKLKSTYVEGLLKVVNPDTKKVHTTFKQALTMTGRLSSTEPNLQNIPIKQAEGRELRKFFIASKGNILVDADYSQIELRILAALSGDETMCRAFKDGVDIHTLTASQVFGVAKEDVTPEMRKSAKAVNFGIVYGISDFSLAGDIGTTRKQAGEYIEKYFAKYPAIRRFLDEQINFAIEKGYVSTLFGRRRYIPELTAKNKVMQAFGKRVAMNSPIQGTAADIIKLAMIRTEKALADADLKAKLILQVHDELIIESSKEDAQRATEILVREMDDAASLAVPLEVEAQIGDTWDSCHG